MILRIRSRDGLERITVPSPSTATISTVQSLIESQLKVPIAVQSLSLNPNLLLSNNIDNNIEILNNPSTPLSALPLTHGSFLYLSTSEPRSSLPPPPPTYGPRRKMTIEDLVARQVRVTPQENPHCSLASFDQNAAHNFQLYVSETLAFSVKRAAFLYGNLDPESSYIFIQFIYEPPQSSTENDVILHRDPDEEALVEAIASGLGMRRIGFIFTQAVGRKKGESEYTLSGKEVLQAVELQVEGDVKEWVTGVVKLEVSEDGAADVHFEAFQMSDVCVRLFKEGWFVREFGEEDDPGVSRMNKEVVVGGKDTKEVDNDFFLVPVKITDHQGPLSSSFPIENRITSVTLMALKNHLDRTKHLPFVKRISDFHLLLLLARFLDANNDVPTLAECVQKQSTVPEGYQLLIDSLAQSA